MRLDGGPQYKKQILTLNQIQISIKFEFDSDLNKLDKNCICVADRSMCWLPLSYPWFHTRFKSTLAVDYSDAWGFQRLGLFRLCAEAPSSHIYYLCP